MTFATVDRHTPTHRIVDPDGDLPRDHLTLLHVGGAESEALMQAAFNLLQIQMAVPLRLKQANVDQIELRPLVGEAALLVVDDTAAISLCVTAMGMDVPVVAASASSPATLAARLRDILQEPVIRRRHVRHQRARMALLEPPACRQSGEYPVAGGWRIEGPFDSSFSLAIVNRSLALELERQGETVTLGSVDAKGPRPPDPTFLAGEPEVETLWRRGVTASMPDVVTRNLWPPHVLDMRGLTRVMTNYAWEESGFPPSDVAAFNATLNLITTTSHFVTKVLRDNGVHVPIAMVGNGIFEPPAQLTPEPRAPGRYRYLHISSCYPRKGVDVLLAAWARGFTDGDGVELVIKTFPNEFNTVAAQIDVLKRDYPVLAPIILIEKDVPEARIHGLYASADAVVCPARGEGFGLPMAEAFAHGKPVVTTGFSGQRDFCTPETAWLCDFRFAYSRAHLGMSVSVWAEPNVDSLIAVMKTVRAAPIEEVARRVGRGQALLGAMYRWDVVARKTRAAVAALENHEEVILHRPKVGWISPWNTEDPIAVYSATLTQDIPDKDLVRLTPPLPTNREWFEFCAEKIQNSGVDALVIQFRPGLMSFALLCKFIAKVEAQDIPVFLFLHATTGPDVDLEQEYAALSGVTRIIVHSAFALNRLKDAGLLENTTLLPRGLPAPYRGDRLKMRHVLGLQGQLVLAIGGTAIKSTNVLDIAMQIAVRLRQHVPQIQFLLQLPENEDTLKYIDTYNLSGCVTFLSEAMSEDDSIACLATADLAFFPNTSMDDTVSTDVHLAIAAEVPCVCMPAPGFDDVAPVVHILTPSRPENPAQDLARMLSSPQELAAQVQRQKTWARQITWPFIRRRVEGMIRGLVLDRRLRA